MGFLSLSWNSVHPKKVGFYYIEGQSGWKACPSGLSSLMVLVTAALSSGLSCLLEKLRLVRKTETIYLFLTQIFRRRWGRGSSFNGDFYIDGYCIKICLYFCRTYVTFHPKPCSCVVPHFLFFFSAFAWKLKE